MPYTGHYVPLRARRAGEKFIGLRSEGTVRAGKLPIVRSSGLGRKSDDYCKNGEGG